MENNGGPWWPPVVMGDGEGAWDVGNGFGRRKEKKEKRIFFKII